MSSFKVHYLSQAVYHTRQGERGVGAVSSGGGLLTCFSHFTCIFAHMLPCGVPFEDENTHGMPFLVCTWCDISQQKCQLMDFWQKRKVCGATSASKGADLWIFGKKGNTGMTSAICMTCRFSMKKEGMTSPGKSPDLQIFSKKGNCVV